MIGEVAVWALGTASAATSGGLGVLAVRYAVRAARTLDRLAVVTEERDRQAAAASLQYRAAVSAQRRTRFLEQRFRDRYGADAAAQAARLAQEAADSAAADTQLIHVVDSDPTRRIYPPARRPDADQTAVFPLGWAVNGVVPGDPR